MDVYTCSCLHNIYEVCDAVSPFHSTGQRLLDAFCQTLMAPFRDHAYAKVIRHMRMLRSKLALTAASHRRVCIQALATPRGLGDMT